jgi:uncharacterized Zn-finger protein
MRLKDHMKCHSKDKRFSCETCGNSYKSKNSLKFHIRKAHTKIGGLKCSFCEKVFFEKNALGIHERHHTGEKPNKCDQIGCEAAFTNRSKLTLHLKNVHGIDARMEFAKRRALCNQALLEEIESVS